MLVDIHYIDQLPVQVSWAISMNPHLKDILNSSQILHPELLSKS
jgi:hypothetical protein